MASQVKIGIGVDYNQFQQGMNQASSAANSFGKALNDTSKKSQTFAGQMRAARKQALELAQAYSALDDAARQSDFGVQMKAQLDQAMAAAAELTDLRGDIMQEISNMASDTKMFDGFAQGLGIVSSGIQGMASVVGLAGGNVESFTKALTIANGVQGVANTIIGIGNALQKQSALMVMLRTVRSKLFTTATVAETAAITANTTATGAQTVATEAATTAQIANNLAVLANPYVACAAAIAALCAGLYIWANANDDVTQSERIKSEALQEMSEQLEKTSDEVGKQISAFTILQHEYQKADGDLDTMKRNMSNFDEVCKAANITLKKQSDAEIVLGKLAPVMIKKYQAEARAAAASAAMAAEYGKILAKVADIQKRIAAGETIDMGDLEKLNINPQQVKNMFKQEAGLDDLFASVFQPSAQDLKYIGRDLEKDMQALAEQAFGAFNEKATVFTTTLDNSYKEIAGYLDELKNAGVDTNILFGDDKVKKATQKAAKHVKSTSKEMNTLLSTLEGCDNVIKRATTDITKLDHKADDFAKKFIALNATILKAKQSKFELLDKSSIQGMADAKKLAQEIILQLEQGSEEYNEWQKHIDDLNESMYSYYKTLSKAGSEKTLSDTKSFIEEIIKNLPQGSEEIKTWVARWREVNDELVKVKRNEENIKLGIEIGSSAELKQQLDQAIKDLQDYRENTHIELSTAFDEGGFDEQYEKLKKKAIDLADAWTTQRSQFRGIEVANVKPVDLTFSYKKSELDKLNDEIQYQENLRDWYLNFNIEIDEDTTFNKFQEQLDETREKIKSLKKEATLKELGEDIKDYTSQMQEAGYKSFQGFTDGLHTLYNVMSELPDRLDECKNGFEGFFEVMDAGFSIVDAVVNFMDNIKKVSEVVTLLTGAKEALSVVNTKNAVTLGEEAAANQTLAASQLETTASQAANIPIATANAVANSNLATATLDLAASQIAAAHASIPFAGPALAAAGIATVTAAVAAAHAAMLGMQAFAEGGVVQGSHTMGDQLLVLANAGEMILNTRQQANLFDLLNSGTNETSSNAPTTTTFKIKGDTLYATLTNYMKITGKKL